MGAAAIAAGGVQLSAPFGHSTWLLLQPGAFTFVDTNGRWRDCFRVLLKEADRHTVKDREALSTPWASALDGLDETGDLEEEDES